MFWNAITYEVNHRRMVINRVDYSLFEWLGDIGGLTGMLLGCAQLTLSFFLGDTSTQELA